MSPTSTVLPKTRAKRATAPPEPKVPKKRGRKPFVERAKPETDRTPRGEFVRPLNLNDGTKRTELPVTGLCSCGKRPYDWNDKAKPDIAWFCPDNTHGGNGRFWHYQGASEGTQVKRTRKSKAA